MLIFFIVTVTFLIFKSVFHIIIVLLTNFSSEGVLSASYVKHCHMPSYSLYWLVINLSGLPYNPCELSEFSIEGFAAITFFMHTLCSGINLFCERCAYYLSDIMFVMFVTCLNNMYKALNVVKTGDKYVILWLCISIIFWY